MKKNCELEFCNNLDNMMKTNLIENIRENVFKIKEGDKDKFVYGCSSCQKRYEDQFYNDIYTKGIKFRNYFVEAYLRNEIREIGLHNTVDDYWKKEMKKGLKHFPNRLDPMRMESGVHYDQLISIKNQKRFLETKIKTKKQAINAFNYLSWNIGGLNEDKNPNLKESQGVVLLREDVPRARFYPNSFEGDIGMYRHKYIPMIKDLEYTVHTLIPKRYILDVIFLSKQEFAIITKKANEKYGSANFLAYKREKVEKGEKWGITLRIDERIKFIEKICGRLLLYKSKRFLLKKNIV